MHLKSIIILISNLYKYYFIVLPLIIIDNEKKYEIERLIRKR